MIIRITDEVVILKFENKLEKTLVKDNFTYNDYSLVFAGGRYDKNKIKKVSLLKPKGGLFFIKVGFLENLLMLCKKEKITISSIKDNRQKVYIDKLEKEEIKKFFPKHFDYIEHQVDAIYKMLRRTRGILKMPTSSGKSMTLLTFAKITGLNILILVNKISLAEQLQKDFLDNGLDCGIYHGKKNIDGKNVIATIGSIKKIPNLDKFNCLVGDEIHRFQSKQFQDFLSEISYPIQFGLSATPEGNDKFKFALIRQYFGEIFHELKADTLIENKVIVKPEITFVKNENPKTLDWPSAQEYAIVQNYERNNIIKKIVEEHNLPTLILVKIITHGEYIEQIIPDSFFVNGSHSIEERIEAIEKFSTGEIKTLIASNIFNEGISINAIRVLIIASGGKSDIETVQKIGRALRKDEGKDKAIVYDFEDDGNIYTQRHSKKRKKIYEQIGFEIHEKSLHS